MLLMVQTQTAGLLQGMKLAKQAANWREQASEQMRKTGSKDANEAAPGMAKHRSGKQA